MASRNNNLSYGNPSLVLQPGWTMTKAVGQGVSIQATYVGEKATFLGQDSDTLITGVVDNFPIRDLADEHGLKRDTWVATFDESQVTVSVSYTGISIDTSQDDDGEKEYEFQVGAASVPIETHPNFTGENGFGGTAESSRENNTIFRDAENNSITYRTNNRTYFDRFAAGHPLHGTESYLAMNTARWRQKYVSSSPPSLTGIGKLDSTPPGNPPAAKGYTWLYMGANFTKVGSVYRISREWMMGKFKEDIYK